MAERTAHAPGTPSWIDLGARDVARATAFYQSVFGWEVEDTGDAGGGYQMMKLRGKYVAGLGPSQMPDGPTYWTTYITVADADETLRVVEKEGGSVVMPAFDVMESGRMGIAADPSGAVFSVWQAKENIGAELVNEPGTLCWNELNTRDVAGARSFYGAVFGWEMLGKDDEYVQFQLDGRSVGGIMPMPPQLPAEVPPHWMVYFAVDDADAAVERVVAGGGSKLTDLMDIEVGRFAVVTDPEGAAFAVIKLNQADD